MRDFKLQPLPAVAVRLCDELGVAPRLRAHLTLVHDAAVQLCDGIDRKWPALSYDREAVLIGAATHDLGKTLHPAELVGPGNEHEADGPALLIRHGLPPAHARFAGTHGKLALKADATVEDVLVALADNAWKGSRGEALEEAAARKLAELSGQEAWNTFSVLDTILQRIAKHAQARLDYQQTFAR